MPPDTTTPAPQPAPAAAPPAEPTIAYESQLSPELRADKSIREAIKDAPKLNDLVKAHRDLKGRLSRAIIVPDAQNPDPQEMKEFRTRMGLPETAEGYTFDTAAYKDLPGVDEVVKLARSAAADMSLTTKQAQKFADVILRLSKEGQKQISEAMKTEESTFPQRLAEVAGSPEKAQETLNLMKAFLVKRMAKPELIKKLAQRGILYDTDFATTMAELAEVLGEEPTITGEDGQARADRKKERVEGDQGKYSPDFVAQHGPRKGKGAK